MIEFAIVAPILFALVFGVFDFGRAMSANVTITNATREAARYAAAQTVSGPTGTVSGSDGRFGFECPSGSPLTITTDGPTKRAWEQAEAANLDLNRVSITVYYYASGHDPVTDVAGWDEKQSCSGSTAVDDIVGGYTPSSGDWVKVDISYGYTATTPVISSIFPTIQLDQSATMVLE